MISERLQLAMMLQALADYPDHMTTTYMTFVVQQTANVHLPQATGEARGLGAVLWASQHAAVPRGRSGFSKCSRNRLPLLKDLLQQPVYQTQMRGLLPFSADTVSRL